MCIKMSYQIRLDSVDHRILVLSLPYHHASSSRGKSSNCVKNIAHSRLVLLPQGLPLLLALL